MLKYIGDGSFIPGVPARDLGDVEVKLIAEAMQQPDLVKVLVQSGLYERVGIEHTAQVEAKIDSRTKANKSLRPETENK